METVFWRRTSCTMGNLCKNIDFKIFNEGKQVKKIRKKIKNKRFNRTGKDVCTVLVQNVIVYEFDIYIYYEDNITLKRDLHGITE